MAILCYIDVLCDIEDELSEASLESIKEMLCEECVSNYGFCRAKGVA